MSVVLQVRGLRKQYKEVEALRGLDLDVHKGEVFGFLGPNGAGKTTFTKCVTGFVRPSAGEVHVQGIDALRRPTRVAEHIGLVPDQYDFYPNLTGRQHLDFYGRLQGLSATERKGRIGEVLSLVRMNERADSRVKTYSHGMKQRICIAQAMLHKPDLIFFDEPTNGLDPKGAYELREMIRGLARDGTTVFLNSHVLHEVEQVCERVAILYRGELRALEKVEDLRRTAGGVAKVRLLNPSKKLTTAAKKVANRVRADGPLISFEADDESVAETVTAIVKAGGKITAVEPPSSSLEDVFLRLTEDEA